MSHYLPTPFPDSSERWPACWIFAADRKTPCFHFYRLRFEIEIDAEIPVWVTADQRFILFLDDAEVARGPERGDPFNWHFAKSDLYLRKGSHVLSALVWSLDQNDAPAAQMTRGHGFLLAANGELEKRLSTGLAAWETRPAEGIQPRQDYTNQAAFLAGCNFDFEGASIQKEQASPDSNWTTPETGFPAQEVLTSLNWGNAQHLLLRPSDLPPMLSEPFRSPIVRHIDESLFLPEKSQSTVEEIKHLPEEVDSWKDLLASGYPLEIPAHTRRRVILDFEEYLCAFTRLQTSGGKGALISIGWAESLFHSFEYDGVKGHRDKIESKSFHGRTDLFHPTKGICRFPALWWNCGRYVQVTVETMGDALSIQALNFEETRYPMEREDQLETGLSNWNAIANIMWRTLQMCAHETYMDCPYYEQLQYGGDTRVQMLVTYAGTRDARLPRKTLRSFAASIQPNGLTQSRFPCHSAQVIPQFSLYWIAMLHDFTLWRGEMDYIRQFLPAARRVLDAFISRIDGRDRLHTPDGWNWVDWTVEWRLNGRGPESGHPPLDDSRLSGINHLHFIYIAGLAADLERWLGEAVFAERLERIRHSLMEKTREVFWNKKKGLFADTPSHTSFSQHAQCFAILSGLLDKGTKSSLLQRMLSDPSLAQATVYFKHYVFESMWACGQGGLVTEHLDYWKELQSKGFRTTIERPDPSRSDCHAWGAHPIFHLHASVGGIRPTQPGFEKFVIAPAKKLPRHFRSVLPHPKGELRMELSRMGDSLQVQLEIPEETSGEFRWNGTTRSVKPGSERFMIKG